MNHKASIICKIIFDVRHIGYTNIVTCGKLNDVIWGYVLIIQKFFLPNSFSLKILKFSVHYSLKSFLLLIFEYVFYLFLLRTYAERIRGEARKKWLQQVITAAETGGASIEPVYKAIFQALYKVC